MVEWGERKLGAKALVREGEAAKHLARLRRMVLEHEGEEALTRITCIEEHREMNAAQTAFALAHVNRRREEHHKEREQSTHTHEA